MKITQLRNATAIIDIAGMRILIDPMLASKNALPPLRLLGERARNPLVELPPVAEAALETITHCLITHCQKGHFDHLDRAAKRWLREKQIPVICTPHDAEYLRKRGLNVRPLAENHAEPQPFFGGRIRTVPCVHGRGMVGLLMEHGVGYFIEMPGEPSLYLSGDTILTATVRAFIGQHQPEVALVPAGGARFDFGHEIIMDSAEVVKFCRGFDGIVVANHLEALSHCPVTRAGLLQAGREAGLDKRLLVPADGETLEFEGASRRAAA